MYNPEAQSGRFASPSNLADRRLLQLQQDPSHDLVKGQDLGSFAERRVFNFNSFEVRTGVQLDTDQIIYRGS